MSTIGGNSLSWKLGGLKGYWLMVICEQLTNNH